MALFCLFLLRKLFYKCWKWFYFEEKKRKWNLCLNKRKFRFRLKIDAWKCMFWHESRVSYSFHNERKNGAVFFCSRTSKKKDVHRKQQKLTGGKIAPLSTVAVFCVSVDGFATNVGFVKIVISIFFSHKIIKIKLFFIYCWFCIEFDKCTWTLKISMFTIWSVLTMCVTIFFFYCSVSSFFCIMKSVFSSLFFIALYEANESRI